MTGRGVWNTPDWVITFSYLIPVNVDRVLVGIRIKNSDDVVPLVQ